VDLNHSAFRVDQRCRTSNGIVVPSRRWLELGWRSLRVVQPK
jgi:hypothetical protein